MTILQVVLAVGLLGLAVYAYSQRTRSRIVAWGMVIVCLAGELFVFAPELANVIAAFVGVGRGADLIMYTFIVASLGLILNLHIRLHAVGEDVTELARRVAIANAKTPLDETAGQQGHGA